MRAMVLENPVPAESSLLKLLDIPIPEPADGELLIRVEVCGVCRTDLHVANTRKDGQELIKLAAEIPLYSHTEVFQLEQATEALRKLKIDGINGAAVLRVRSGCCKGLLQHPLSCASPSSLKVQTDAFRRFTVTLQFSR